MDRSISHRGMPGTSWFRSLILVAGLALVAASSSAFANQPCGTKSYPFPYTDVASVTDPFCPGIMEAYVTGISKGTSPTTFGPNNDVPRLQMTTFLQRTVDQGLTRASRRAALKQWWTPQDANNMQQVNVGSFPQYCTADGENIWVTNNSGNQVIQVQASTGKVLGTWTGALSSFGILAANGKIFVTGETSPGNLYVIDPTQAPGAVATADATLGNNSVDIAFDGTHLWTANLGPPGSVSKITQQATIPYPATTVTAGFNSPSGILYDGAHIWVADFGANQLLKLDINTGAILQAVAAGNGPHFPGFDGTNIWVPNYYDSSITVVQASTGNVVATIPADGTNMLIGPAAASFDGERILVSNFNSGTVTLFKAADLSFIANVSTAAGGGSAPYGACSDGINFWIPLSATSNLLRF